jgi:hypothetical protein
VTLPIWHDEAACRDADPHLFDSDRSVDSAAATIQVYCNQCPVISDCFAWALGSDFDGVAAGYMWSGARHRRTRPYHFTEEQMLAAHFAYTHGGVRDDQTSAGERAYQRMRKRKQREAVQREEEAVALEMESRELAVARSQQLLEEVKGWTKRKNEGVA